MVVRVWVWGWVALELSLQPGVGMGTGPGLDGCKRVGEGNGVRLEGCPRFVWDLPSWPIALLLGAQRSETSPLSARLRQPSLLYSQLTIGPTINSRIIVSR